MTKAPLSQESSCKTPRPKFRGDVMPLMRQIFEISASNPFSKTQQQQQGVDNNVDNAVKKEKELVDDLQRAMKQYLQSCSSISELRDGDGLTPLHWSAGCDFRLACECLVKEGYYAPNVMANGRRTLGRTPAHYAARNGHVKMLELLASFAAMSGEHRGAVLDIVDVGEYQGVTPLQMAVWQNQLPVVRYLVEICKVDPHRTNHFSCGPQHWLGIVPPHRADFPFHNNNDNNDDDDDNTVPGKALLEMAWYFHSLGVNFHQAQKQGHTAFHKAAWGGNLAFCQWLRDVVGMVDDMPDDAGNYAYDVALMRRGENNNDDDTKNSVQQRQQRQQQQQQQRRMQRTVEWLQFEGSAERLWSRNVLGLSSTDDDRDCNLLRRAYLVKVRQYHPDVAMKNLFTAIDRTENNDDDFLSLCRAYEFLKSRGSGHFPSLLRRRMNSKHIIPLLLLNEPFWSQESTEQHQKQQQYISLREGDDNVPEGIGNHNKQNIEARGKNDDDDDDDGLFKTRILAVLAEFGSDGIGLSNVAKKWNQVWPNVPLYNSNTEKQEKDDDYTVRKKKVSSLPKNCRKGKLARYLLLRASDVLEIVPATTMGGNSNNSNEKMISLAASERRQNQKLLMEKEKYSDFESSVTTEQQKVNIQGQHDDQGVKPQAKKYSRCFIVRPKHI